MTNYPKRNYPFFIGSETGDFRSTGLDIDSDNNIVFGGYGYDPNYDVFSSFEGSFNSNINKAFIVLFEQSSGTFLWSLQPYKDMNTEI
jgi:hypothetical protein